MSQRNNANTEFTTPSKFIELLDVSPHNYVGDAGKVYRVKNDESGLEPVAPGSIINIGSGTPGNLSTWGEQPPVLGNTGIQVKGEVRNELVGVSNVEAGEFTNLRLKAGGEIQIQDNWFLPNAAATAPGQVLTDVAGDGNTSWETPTGGGGGSFIGLYVSKAIGSDATGTGTISAPFATFGRALFGIADNTTIYCLDSLTYDENLNINANNINVIAPLAKLVPTTGFYSINLNVNSPTSVQFATIAGVGSADMVQIATYGNLFITCKEFYSNISCNAGGYLNLNSSLIGASVTWNAGGGFIYGYAGLNVSSPGVIFCAL